MLETGSPSGGLLAGDGRGWVGRGSGRIRGPFIKWSLPVGVSVGRVVLIKRPRRAWRKGGLVGRRGAGFVRWRSRGPFIK